MLLFLLSGLLLLRFADRQFLALLFKSPPRLTSTGDGRTGRVRRRRVREAVARCW